MAEWWPMIAFLGRPRVEIRQYSDGAIIQDPL